MLLIAIVDDDPKDAEALRLQTEEYYRHKGIAHIIHVFPSGLDFIRSAENHDIIFMDIHMEKLDGLEVARILRKLNSESVLIFVTYMAQLAIKGYEVDALDFIVKPITQSSIRNVLDKAMKRLEHNSCTTFALKIPNGTASISSNDITYVEVFDHNLVYHTVKGDYTVRGRLSDVYEKLDKQRFILCNRSFIVNLRYVSSINNEYLVVENTRISVSKSHRKEILQRFSNFLGDTL